MSFSDQTLPAAEMTDEDAERWIASAIAEAEAHFWDDWARRPSSPDPAEVARAEAVHAALAKWVRSAEALLDRLATPGAADRMPSLHELNRTIVRAECRLQIEPVPRPNVPGLSLQEVRDELRRRRSA